MENAGGALPGAVPEENPAPPPRVRKLDAYLTVISLLPLVLLSALTVTLAYEGGAFGPGTWLPFVIGLAAFAIFLTAGGPGLTADRTQRVILVLFAAQMVWTFASLLWASSRANAWEEANRTLFYALVIALTFVALRWGRRMALSWLPVLLLAAITVVAIVTFLMLGFKSDPAEFLLNGRLKYPVTYFNGLAAFLLIGFWLTLGLANATRRRVSGVRATLDRAGAARAHRFRWWMQPIFLAIGVFLAELALLPQSRGGLWSLCMVVPFFFILSPHRVRAFVNLVIVALPIIVFWGKWSAVYSAVSRGEAVGPPLDGALRAMGYSVLVVLVLWLVTWLVEQRIGELPGRSGFWVGAALGVLILFCCVGGILYADQRSGGVAGYVQDRWEEFVSDKAEAAGAGSRFGAFGLDGRLTLWKVAGTAFEDNPVLGLGAQNFEIYWYEHRAVTMAVRQPHSQPMQLLSELGLPGLLLYIAFFALVLVRAVILRFGAAGRRAGRTNNALLAAMMTAVLSWFIHSSADWLWQLAAVTVPAMILVGGLAGVDATHLVYRRRRSGSRATENSDEIPAKTAYRTGRKPSRLGTLVRPAIVVLAVLAIVSAGLPYLSSRFAGSASAAISVNPQNALARANTVARLDPTSTAPYAIRAGVHAAAAARAPEGSAGRALELLLAAQAWEGATQVEPDSWVYHSGAAKAYLLARDAARAVGGAQGAAAQVLDAKVRFHASEVRRLNPLRPEGAAYQ